MRYLCIYSLHARSMWPVHMLLHARSVRTSFLHMWRVHILFHTYSHSGRARYLGIRALRSRSMWPMHFLSHPRSVCTSLLRMWPVQKYAWKIHMFKMGLSAFSGYQGGASAGAGCTQEAMTDVFKHNNKA